MTRVLLSALVAPSLVACGDDDMVHNPQSPSPAEGVNWYDAHDPETGRTFRCFDRTFDSGSYAGGLTTFCYDPSGAR